MLVDLKTSQQNNSTLNYPELDNAKFINLASLLDMEIRHENRNPTLHEYLTRQIAYEMINIRGYNEAPIVPWGNSGFRKIQTQASMMVTIKLSGLLLDVNVVEKYLHFMVLTPTNLTSKTK